MKDGIDGVHRQKRPGRLLLSGVDKRQSRAGDYKVAQGDLSRHDAGRIKSQFQSHLQLGYYCKIPIEPRYFQIARNWIAQFETSLRKVDGLHLAVASNAGLTLLTADLARWAEHFAVEVQLVRREITRPTTADLLDELRKINQIEDDIDTPA